MAQYDEDVIRLESINTEGGQSNYDDPLEFECLTLPEFDSEYLDDQDYREAGASDVTVKRIPFSEVYNVYSEEESRKQRFFLPGQKIHVTITDAYVPDNSRAINPYVYVIQLEHGEYEWTIRRRWKHFRHVHEQLVLFRAKVNIVRTREMEQRRKSIANRKQQLPNFPKRPDRLVEDMEQRKKQLEEYLATVLRSAQYRNHPEMLKFLEVSRLSFVNQLGDKRREGFVNKRSGGGKVGGCFSFCKRCPCNGWKVRWLMVKDTFVAYLKPETNEIRYVMLMDHDFKVKLLGSSVLNSILISNNTRKLELFSWTGRKADEWKESIEEAANTTGKEFIEPARLESFAPQRNDIPCKWFVDAAGFMNDVADALEAAREEIFITDWWLSPEVYLKRPFPECERWRLDLVLQRKAQMGVKVFVLLWKELPMAVGINSLYTKQALTRLHPDIRVLRDPDGFVNYWSHHEKIVCVDQKIAFVGGIDLCYGRWDTPLHRLTDLGQVSVTTPGVEQMPNPFELPPGKPEPELPTSRSAFYHRISQEERDREELEQKELSRKRKRERAEKAEKAERSRAAFRSGEAQSFDEVDKSKGGLSHERADSERVRSPTFVPGASEKRKVYQRSASVPSDFKDTHSTDSGWEDSVIKNNHAIIEEEEEVEEDKKSEKSGKSGKSDKSGKSGESDKSESSEEEYLEEDGLPTETGIDNDSFEMEEAASKSPSPSDSVEGMSPGNGHLPHQDSTESSQSGSRKVPKMSGLVKTHMSKLVPKSTTGENGEVQVKSFASAVEEVMNKPQAFKDYLRGLSEEMEKQTEDDELVEQIRNNLNKNKDSKAYFFKKQKHITQDDSPATTTTDKAKAEFSKRHIEKVLKAQGSDDALNVPDMGGKQDKEKNASPKARSKLLQWTDSMKRPLGVLLLVVASITYAHGLLPVGGDYAIMAVLSMAVFSPGNYESIAQRARDLKTEMRQKYGGLSRPADLRAKFTNNRSKSMDVDTKLRATNGDTNILESILYKAKDNPDFKLIHDQESKFWIGKDYTNFIFKDFVDLDKPFTDFIDRSSTPRMPWHDISAVVYGKAARDVARHFIQRWNFTKKKKKDKDAAYPLLVPKTYSRVFVPPSVYTDPRTMLCDVQVLRSASAWSAGISKTECSIYNAYMDCIANSQHYIYIENQFFISIEENMLVSNHIQEALYQRICKAHREKKTFRVIVVLPLLPAFEGELGTTTGTSIQAVQHWNYASICRGAHSLLGRLATAVNDPFKYISFYCLRNWGDIMGSLKSELVYVHSKLLIVDDRRVIIGSANINDRSLLGDRDSEIGILVEDRVDDDDDAAVRSTMDGKPYMAGRFAFTLRTALYKEHLGCDLQAVMDPISTAFYTDHWMKQAAINTDVFEKVFNCVPSDLARTFGQMKLYQSQPVLAEEAPGEARKKLKAVKGHVVLLPLHFLYEEELQPAALSKEGLAPTFIWT